MPLWLLEAFDRITGKFLLCVLAVPLAILRFLLQHDDSRKAKHIFIKMKGGGSLIIAMPTLVGLRQKTPEAETYLVCTTSAQSYAELTGAFDHYLVINDRNLWTLLSTALCALHKCFHAALCVDLEPNSLLAAVFTVLTCADKRVGFVKASQKSRSIAYTHAIDFNPNAPIYTYYDELSHRLGASTASTSDCRAVTKKLLPSPSNLVATSPHKKLIGIAAFTSDFASQRMMPSDQWRKLLQQTYGHEPLTLLIFGTVRNASLAGRLTSQLAPSLPQATIINLCGQHSLAETTSLITTCLEVWTVDTGLLHLARLMGVPTRSYWGPTSPSQRLRPIPDLDETVFYRPFSCSPCVEVGQTPPCKGHNLCMMTMADQNPNLNPVWE